MPLTQEVLKERIVKNEINVAMINGKEVDDYIFVLYPSVSKKNDDNTIEIFIDCGVYNSEGNLVPLNVKENKPMIISIENDKYRIKSMPAQSQKGCYKF
ncbi:hypothetical protein OFO01_03770 [Campylobacter sp. JMF_01 NE2]|uniref:hypothetical protein n=1 Tax=unclassified Campylobacter TaxID=2593542 RepID=UPI0022E9CBE1|nr:MULTISPECIES: hypothetical protein [unclassified Campylobacter]MDA3052564.1 hypothetical protein [Campylobacter sp. JMF_03 NE3]MDA3066896.1 hypothetical protein [Campylobacter sp. JMF_01 NE2]